MQAPGDARALFQREEAIVAAGQGHAHMALRQQRIAQGQGKRQGQLLFAQAAFPAGAGIMTAMAGIDHHQRPAGISRAEDRRQVDRARAVGQGHAHHIGRHLPAPPRSHAKHHPRPHHGHQQRHHEQRGDCKPLRNRQAGSLTMIRPPMPRRAPRGPVLIAAAHHRASACRIRVAAHPQKDGAFQDTVLIAAL
jgi:hypothetical protein